ncbi:hypothetical protein [Myroides sp. LoEW2-1]|uniref:hypothetical protein n=1 Tax=Myroides sp. LoEW2-1 TaxID=2683192 RepID=UPI0013265C2D|nr:hypothetical protein [Myroides sp. LoEW2-1]MVX37239.1 hypothetical protein [Myroides sp. LoEW2-1]
MEKIVVTKLVPKGYAALTLYPFIFVRKEEHKQNKILLNHERIHLRQQKRLFVIGFLIWYLLEYLFLLLKFRNHDKAYRNISFEKEAYTN